MSPDQLLQNFLVIMLHPDKVDSPCWLWQRALNSKGYGMVKVNGKMELVHRWMWTLANGQPIPKRKLILHACDEKQCGNPLHLSPGTHSKNLLDSWARCRRTAPRSFT